MCHDEYLAVGYNMNYLHFLVVCQSLLSSILACSVESSHTRYVPYTEDVNPVMFLSIQQHLSIQDS